jgi:RNA polymerase sigma factor (sigma-70 family)
MGEHDGILLDRWASTGDNQAFMELVARYQGMVYGTCVRIVKDQAKAEDLVQECFLKLTKNRPKSSHTLGPWLHRVATHASINQLRSDTRRIQREKTFMSDKPSNAEATWNDIDEILDEELNTLPQENREVIVAHFLQGQTQVEVAEQLGVPRTTVVSRIKAGLDKLERKLKSRGVLVPAAALSAMMTTEITSAAPASLANAMGKAVLKGMFVHETAATLMLPKILVSVAVALVLLVGAYTVITNDAPPETEGTETAVQQTLVAAQKPQPPPEPATTVLPSAEEEVDEPSTVNVDAEPAGETIRLQCIDEALNPIADVEVYVIQKIQSRVMPIVASKNNPNTFRATGPLTSDADGFVEFAAFVGRPEESGYRAAYAVVPNQWVGTWSQSVNRPYPTPENKYKIRMVPSKTVPGRVILPEGYDMSVVRVDTMYLAVPETGRTTISFSPHNLPEGVFTDLFSAEVEPSGHFEMHNLPSNGRFNVRAHRTGLGETQRHVFETEQIARIELPMKQEAIIEGYVREEGTGNAVVGRYVACRTYSNKGIARQHVSVTDAAGKYRIDGLAPGKYEVFVPRDTDYPAHIVRPQKDILAEEGFVTEDVNFTLESGVVVRGQMTSEDTGAPIENVVVRALNPAETGGVFVNGAVSDASGNYEIRLPIGDSLVYIMSTPNGVRRPQQPHQRVLAVAHSPAVPAGPVNFLFKTTEVPKGIFVGRVVDLSGNPISGAQINAGSRNVGSTRRPMSIRNLTTTGTDGRFRISMAADKEYQFIIGGSEWSAHRAEKWHTVAAGETVDIGEFRLVAHVEEMSAQVLDEAGNPIGSLRYSLDAKDFYRPNQNALSDSEGMIYLKNLPDAEITIFFYGNAFRGQSWKGFPGEHVEIVLNKK